MKANASQPGYLQVRFEFRDGCVMDREAFVAWYALEGRASMARHQFIAGLIESKLHDPGWKEVHCTYKQTGGSRRVPRHSWHLEFV